MGILSSMQPFVLFDFDGVIADSFKPAFDIHKLICPHLTEEEYRKRFEGNINDWQDPIDVHTPECRRDIDFFTEYVPRMRNEVRVIPGIKEALAELTEHYTLIIVSSTTTSPIQEFLESHALTDHFDWVMGNDVHTSKVEKIKMVFAKYKVSASDCIFITDTLGDMHEATKMEVSSIGVTWGFHSPETLAEGNPYNIVNQPADLPTVISTYFARTEP